MCIFIKFDTHVNIIRLQKCPHRHTGWNSSSDTFRKPQQHTFLYFKFIALNYNQKSIIQFKFLFPRSLARFFLGKSVRRIWSAPFIYSANCDTAVRNLSLFVFFFFHWVCVSVSTKSMFTNKKFRFIFCVTESREFLLFSFYHISFAYFFVCA